MMFFIYVILLLPIFLVLIFLVQPFFIIRFLAKKNPEVLYFANTERKVVALTIDDGPHADVTPYILDVLKKYSAHATFFLLGENIKANGYLIEKMKSDGHEIGNHLF